MIMATFTNPTKSTTSFTSQTKSGQLGYIVTPDLFYILVGENEDQKLAWSMPTFWTNPIKN